MNYRILHPSVGTVGDAYIPAEGINIAALVNNGFIEVVEDAPKPKKSAKTDPVTTEE